MQSQYGYPAARFRLHSRNKGTASEKSTQTMITSLATTAPTQFLDIQPHDTGTPA